MNSRVTFNLYLLIIINCISKNSTKIVPPVIEDIITDENQSKGIFYLTKC